MNLKSSVERLEELLDAFSDNALMSNWIIGHPYEGQKEFQETLDFIKRKKLWNVTYATYQNTPGIASSKMPQITEEEKEARKTRFIEVVIELRKEFLHSLIGKTVKAYPYKADYYAEGRYELLFEGKQIKCVIIVPLLESRENSQIVAKLDYFEETLVKIVGIEDYDTNTQKVCLRG